MNVKISIFKFLLTLTLVNECSARVHSNHTRTASFVEFNNSTMTRTMSVQYNLDTNSSGGYWNTGINAFKRVINALPNPKQIFNYGKQALVGIPEEIASSTKKFLCSKAVHLNDIQKEYIPNFDDLNYWFITQDRDNVTLPLRNSEFLFNHRKFHMNWNVVLFVTGWNLNSILSNETITALYEAYRCRIGYNFVVLDTSKFANSMYAWSEFSTEPIGELIGSAIANLTRFVPYERIHLIGQGIGCHIAGMAGRHFMKLKGHPLQRITGLNPSRPCFSESDRANGLQRGDAVFVDIIHSTKKFFGSGDPIGDVDFYPNGPNIILSGCWSISCVPIQSYQFYAETVYPGNDYLFNATKCKSIGLFRLENCGSEESKIPLGIATPNWARGNFYLTSPFSQHRTRCNDLWDQDLA